MTAMASICIILKKFYHHIGVYMGFVTLGASVFTIVMPYIFSFIISKYGIENVFRFQAFLYIVPIVGVYVWKTDNTTPQFVSAESLERIDSYSIKESSGIIINSDYKCTSSITNFRPYQDFVVPAQLCYFMNIFSICFSKIF
ncbi:hypothetical protein A3Q56_08009 [Intoshia linei]|uniref:Uncharacterized protein n=1 Tax=Intoshia linei TaxID=1819745 RepID=A0A177AQK0_9BILA|nr:hypothetical protein A3Q56_08009 [Intoshia linei]